MKHLVLFDLECPFCQRSILWLQNKDRFKKFLFSSLNGKTSQSMKSFLSVSDKESVILIENFNTRKQAVSYRSKAVFKILSKLTGPWKILGVLRIFPAALFDWGYNLVAGNRKKICPLNTSYAKQFDEKRFLP